MNIILPQDRQTQIFLSRDNSKLQIIAPVSMQVSNSQIRLPISKDLSKMLNYFGIRQKQAVTKSDVKNNQSLCSPEVTNWAILFVVFLSHNLYMYYFKYYVVCISSRI